MDVDLESGAESSLSPSETHGSGEGDEISKVDPLKWTVRAQDIFLSLLNLYIINSNFFKNRHCTLSNIH